MALTLDRQALLTQMNVAFETISKGAVVLHTDILRVGILGRPRNRDELAGAYLDLLHEASSGRAFVFPTFNYDFCRTGRFDRLMDPCQVGALNEYARLQRPEARTWTPIFNFVELGGSELSRGSFTNVFGPDSTFSALAASDATIGFMGAGFEFNTFLHHIEETANVPYRYHKPFSGMVVSREEEVAVSIVYRVRPNVEGACEYDWDRLVTDLIHCRLLGSHALGNGQLLLIGAGSLKDYWCRRIDDDPHFLLSPRGREVAKTLYQQHGRPLTYEAVETPSMI